MRRDHRIPGPPSPTDGRCLALSPVQVCLRRALWPGRGILTLSRRPAPPAGCCGGLPKVAVAYHWSQSPAMSGWKEAYGHLAHSVGIHIARNWSPGRGREMPRVTQGGRA